MDRRLFIRNTSLTGMAWAVPQALRSSQSIRSALALEEITVSELQRLMAEGKATAVSITGGYIERIRLLDKSGPKLNSVIELNPEALSIAESLDKERMSGKLRGPLHGIPVLIKDNIDTGDKMMTTAGSLALINNYAGEDAFIAKKLRMAGAIILGKTNLTEWSNFRSTRAVSGWSSRGGQTRNACVLDRNPSGSSSGSATAVAASLCAVAVGTETDGSIISPSSHNGVVGIKPTTGLWSRSGIIPISSTQDTAGPIARTVADAAALLGACTGVDEQDNVTRESDGRWHADYTKFLDAGSLSGKRIGVEKSFLRGHESVVALYRSALEQMREKGANVIEVELNEPFSNLDYPEFTLMLYEFKEGINRYLAKSKGELRDLHDLIEFNRANEQKVMPYFKQEIFEASQAKGDLGSSEYRTIIGRRAEVRRLINTIFDKNKVDCICGVSTGPAGAIDIINGDYGTGFYFCSPAAAAGYPHITVPMGKVNELPVGLTFVGKAYSEPTLISLAYAYEQASKKREAPRFLTTLIPGL